MPVKIGKLRNTTLRRLMLIIACLLPIFLAGCNTGNQPKPGVSIAGVANLSDPDPATGHAGILMFLAGTAMQARTDTDGRYTITGVPAGTYDLVAEKLGYQGQIINNIVLDGAVHSAENPFQPRIAVLAKGAPAADTTDTVTTATVPQFARVNGTVLLERSPASAGGVRIEIDKTAFVTVSNSEGRYQLLNVEPGTYTFSFYKEGHRTHVSEPIEVMAGENTISAVALEADGPIGETSGTVASAAVAPPPPVSPSARRSITGRVVVTDVNGQPSNDFTSVTVALNGTDTFAPLDPQGNFRFDNLTSGVYTVVAAIPDGPVAETVADVMLVATAQITLRLNHMGDTSSEELGAITGTVVVLGANDEPLPDASGVRVSVTGTQSVAVTARDGRFNLSNIAAGTYTVQAALNNYETYTAEDVVVDAGQTTDLGAIELVLERDYPRVVSTSPQEGAADITPAINLPILLNFSKRMNADTVRQAISVTPPTNFVVHMGSGSYPDADDDTAVVLLDNTDEQNPIKFKSTYAINVDASASDTNGVGMKENFALTFRTGAPGVTRTYPADGEDAAVVDSVGYPVSIYFNTKLEPDSVSERNFKVKPNDRISLVMNHAEDPVTGWSVVTIGTLWQQDTEYTITVGRGVRSYLRQTLGNTPYTFSFRTARQQFIDNPPVEVR